MISCNLVFLDKGAWPQNVENKVFILNLFISLYIYIDPKGKVLRVISFRASDIAEINEPFKCVHILSTCNFRRLSIKIYGPGCKGD